MKKLSATAHLTHDERIEYERRLRIQPWGKLEAYCTACGWLGKVTDCRVVDGYECPQCHIGTCITVEPFEQWVRNELKGMGKSNG